VPEVSKSFERRGHRADRTLVAQASEPFWNSANSLPKPGKEDDVKLPKVCPTCGRELPED
jgi:hypothetical protein